MTRPSDVGDVESHPSKSFTTADSPAGTAAKPQLRVQRALPMDLARCGGSAGQPQQAALETRLVLVRVFLAWAMERSRPGELSQGTHSLGMLIATTYLSG
jgi:hypothetical protein